MSQKQSKEDLRGRMKDDEEIRQCLEGVGQDWVTNWVTLEELNYFPRFSLGAR